VRQASHPPHPIRRRKAAVAMPRTVIVPAAKSAYEGSPILLVQRAATPITGRAAKPRPLPLLTSERPFLFKLNDLCLAIDGDDDLRPAQTTDPQYRVVFQKLVVGPFLLGT